MVKKNLGNIIKEIKASNINKVDKIEEINLAFEFMRQQYKMKLGAGYRIRNGAHGHVAGIRYSSP